MNTDLAGKNILLGVTGGIAAYKSCELVRLLVKAGAEVQVVMTPAATEFVTPLTFKALSSREVYVDEWQQDDKTMLHIDLARQADMVLIAPASADFISKMVHGAGDVLLATLLLAFQGPVAIAPAMNRVMWQQVSTRENIRQLKSRGVRILGPASGDQACGETGEGRMLEPGEILALVNGSFDAPLKGVNVLITAGPTYEDIDPVRFIGNRSSGRMAYAMALAAWHAGARVAVVSGPVHLDWPEGIAVEKVRSARQMHDAVLARVGQADIFIAAAAVADYRPAQKEEKKIKKTERTLSLELTRNPDILEAVGKLEKKPFCVGFAAETHELEHFAREKMQKKNLDMVIANPVGLDDSGFDSDFNRVVMIGKENREAFERQDKLVLAESLVSRIAEQFRNNT